MNLFHGHSRKFLHLRERIRYYDPAYPYKDCWAQLLSFIKHACAHYTYWYIEMVLLILASLATARVAFGLLFSSHPYFRDATLLTAMILGILLVLFLATLYLKKKKDRAMLLAAQRIGIPIRGFRPQREAPIKLKTYKSPELLQTRHKEQRSSGFKDFLQVNLISERDLKEAEFRAFTLVAKKIIPNVYQNFNICVESCNEILKSHNLQIVFQANQTDKTPLLLDQLELFLDFLKYELLGISYPAITEKSKQIGLKYKQFSKMFLTSQHNLKKDLLHYMYQLLIFVRYFQLPGFQSFSYTYNRTCEIEKLSSIDQVQSRTGGQAIPGGTSWSQFNPTDTQIFSHIFSWHFDKEKCDRDNYSLLTDHCTIYTQKNQYYDRLKGVFIQCQDSSYTEPYYEVSNQGTLFPTQPGKHSLFQAIVIYLYILYRQGEVKTNNLEDVARFVLLPLLKRT